MEESEANDNEEENNAQEDLDLEESNADLTIAETSQELHATVTTPTSDIAILNEDEAENVSAEANDDALSVVLEESLSPTVMPNNEDVNISAMDMQQKTSLDEEEDTTSLPQEAEHVVIKKVLDEKEIFAAVNEETTAEPIVPVASEEESVGAVDETPQPTIVEEQAPQNEEPKSTVLENHLSLHAEPQPTIIAEQASHNEQEEEQNIKTTENEDQSNHESVLNNNEHKSKQNTKDIQNQEAEEILTVNTEVREGKQLDQEINVEQTVNEEDTDLNSPTDTENEEVEEVNEPEAEKQYAEDDVVNPILTEEELSTADEKITQHSQLLPSTTESAFGSAPEIHNEVLAEHSSSSNDFHFLSSTESANRDIVAEIPVEDMDYTKTVKGSRSVNRALIDDDGVATLFDTYPPHDSDQTFNGGNLADESLGIGKALPVTTNEGSNRSTIIIVLSSGTACLFIVISVTIFMISFQRQHGTLDIEMQERSCGKDNLDEEDAETFAKLLEVELPPSVAIALEETEECL